MKYYIILLALMSLVLFITMGSDKRQARQAGRRVPEARLFLLALLGGALGGTLGMYAFRHKTRHWYFKLFPLIALSQLALLIHFL